MLREEAKDVRWSELPINPDLEMIELESLVSDACAQHVALEQLMPIICLPTMERRDVLLRNFENISQVPVYNQRPLLLPEFLHSRIVRDVIEISIEDCIDPKYHYFFLNNMRNAVGNQNLSISDSWYRRHLYRSRQLLADANGLVLDVGCDDPVLSRRLFPSDVQYVGIEPGLGKKKEPCLIGVAEFLPFQNNSLDAVAFLTSLDHVLDYHAALDEAWRVLRVGGTLYLATLVWTHMAELVHDGIHFHHFREFELRGALSKFSVEHIHRYVWKDDEHRFGIYLSASKC